jgi:TPR repeat protein
MKKSIIIICSLCLGVNVGVGMAADSYLLSHEQLLGLERSSGGGDSSASFRIYQHYAIGKDDIEEAFRWLKIAAAQGHMEAKLQYVSSCLSLKRDCNKKQNEDYLWGIVSESDNPQYLIDAHILLGDFYINTEPERALGYYKYAAAESDINGTYKILEYYQKIGASIYDELYWLKVMIDLAKEGSAMRAKLLKRRDFLDKEIKRLSKAPKE